MFSLFTACESPTTSSDLDAQPTIDTVHRSDASDLGQDLAPSDEPLESIRDASVQRDAVDATHPLRVLFVGNSYTYVNDLPATIRALGAATPGSLIEVDSVTEGGATLRDHVFRTGALARIASGRWDVVVIQGQSLEPLLQWVFAIFAMDLANAVREAGARSVWYETWARRAGDMIYLPGRAPSGGTITPFDMTRMLDYAYQAAANVNGGAVARVGIAWQLALNDLPAINLYADDGSHPSPEGTLLSACVLFQSITGRVPRIPEETPFGLAPDRARALCDVAPRVYRATDRVEGAIPICGTTPALSWCAGHCVDLTGDTRNCGACGAECPPPRYCSRGACTCLPAYSFEASYASLSALEARCNGRDQRFGSSCNAAIHRSCLAHGCGNSGFGVETASGSGLDATCLSGNVYETTYRILRRWDPLCDGVTDRDGSHCAVAIQRYCESKGDVGGFGPIAVTGDAVSVTCVPSANGVMERVPAAFFTRVAPACNVVVDPWGPDCRRGSQTACRSRSHRAGFGPVSMSSDGSTFEVTCTRS